MGVDEARAPRRRPRRRSAVGRSRSRAGARPEATRPRGTRNGVGEVANAASRVLSSPIPVALGGILWFARILPAVCVDPDGGASSEGPQWPTPAARDSLAQAGGRRPRPRDSHGPSAGRRPRWPGTCGLGGVSAGGPAGRSRAAPRPGRRVRGASVPASGLPSGAWLVSAGEELGGAEPAAFAGGGPARALDAPSPRRRGRSTARWSCPATSGGPGIWKRKGRTMPWARSCSVVGQKHAVTCVSPRIRMSSPDRWSRARRWCAGEHALRGEQRGGGGARRAARHAAFSAGCSERWTCSGRPPRRRPGQLQRAARPGPSELPRRPAAPGRELLGPGVRVAVAETQLGAVERGAEAACEVAGVQQGEPMRRRPRRPAARPPWRAGRSTAAAGAVVDVVELADRGDPGQRHLRVHGAGQGPVGVRVEPGGDGVHRLAPGPERAAAAVRAPAQRAVERVAVRVGEARAAPRRAAVGRPPGAVSGRTAVNRPSRPRRDVGGRDPGSWAARDQ